MKYIIALLVVAAGLVFSASAQAQTTVHESCGGATFPVYSGSHEICSHTFLLAGTCTGGDMYNVWTVVSGNVAGYGPPYMYPWENEWIQIIGATITDLTPADNYGGWRIGSGYAPDIMLSLAPGAARTASVFYPAGTVWMYPPVGYATGGLPIKDVHGGCDVGQWATLLVDFYYISAQNLTP